MRECVFCDIAIRDPKGQVLKYYSKGSLGGYTDVVVIEPLNPCVEGHLLFIPKSHIDKVGDTLGIAPKVVGDVMMAVSKYLAEKELEANVIINNGKEAEQTVFHLHVHIIPRREGDGVQLPWTYQREV